MMRTGFPFPLRPFLIVLLALATVGTPASYGATPNETEAEKDARMAWWRDAKFGMFIHWGLYSIPAGEWEGKHVPGYAEWIMDRAKIPREEYAKLQKQFNPVKYNADEWVDVAKRAGMKYIVITSKHHDGFCLFNSEHTDYDMAGTPHGRDLLKPLADACHRNDLQICWYHSIMDWHHPDASADRFPKYVDYMKAQLRELLSNYGKIGVMWFDGEWIKEWDEEQGIDLEQYLRGIQSDLIVNNRVGKRKPRSPGDFGTPEQEIPATGIAGWDWETCMTINSTWGYSKYDDQWKTTEDLVRKLIDIVSKGGNFLLNVGPTAEGAIPEKSIERLEGMGRWLAVNGDSIYGTTGSPLGAVAWGRCTAKPGKLFLHVFDWPKDGRLLVPRVGSLEGSAHLLADPSRKALTVTPGEGGLWITLPDAAPDPIASVIVLEGQFEVAPLEDAKK
ncbi:MAG: alpha-L-fucosidase [Patescibacteria group bacterium]|nr:alpha-L-fucosidase [Patescibacteria group bacterium]